MNNTPENTIDLIKNLLISQVQEVINIFQRNYDITLDEEHITYYLSTHIRDTINKRKEEIKKTLIDDINYFLSINGISERYNLITYFDNNLIIDMSLHKRSIEGKKTKSDYSFIFKIPAISLKSSNDLTLEWFSNLINIQAKKLTETRDEFEVSGGIDLSTAANLHFKEFYSICYYYFNLLDKEIKLNDFLFHIVDKKLSDDEFKKALKKALIVNEISKYITIDEFLDKFFKCEIGTSDKDQIDKYTSMLNANLIPIYFDFKDDGEGLKAILERINNEDNQQFVQAGR